MSELNPDALTITDMDEAIIGIGGQYPDNQFVYTRESIIKELLRINEEWKHEDAIEWYEFNIYQAYMGPNTPIIITLLVTPQYHNDDEIFGIDDSHHTNDEQPSHIDGE